MKVVVLMGSPRKKDGFKVCEKIKERLMNHLGDCLEFEYIMLSKLHIEECRGCEQCITKGEQYCPIKDDLQQVVEKLIGADGVILVSPVYACQVSATFKKVIDRLSYLFHRPELIGKPTITVLTTAGGGIKATKSYLKLVADGWACHLIGQLSIVSTRYFEGRWGCMANDIKYKQKIDGQIDRLAMQLGVSIQERVEGKKVKPNLYDVFMFNALKSKTYTSKADYIYWEEKGWLSQSYYYETKLPLGSKLIGKLMNEMVKNMAQRMGME